MSFAVLVAKVKMRGSLELGAPPVMGWELAPIYGTHDTRKAAKAAWARGNYPDLNQGQSDEFCATHFDQAARNEKSVRLVKMVNP